MKSKILLGVITLVIFSSCSSVYKSGQTPDDVYYSPAKEIERTDRREVKEDNFYSDDQYLRMKVRNCNRWRMIDDFDYWYDSRYSFSNCYTNPYVYNGWYSQYYNSWSSSYYYSNCSCSCGYNNWYTWGNYWGNWNSPFYVAYYKNPKINTGNTTGSFVKSYKNTNYNNTNTVYDPKRGNSGNNGFGGLVKRVFSSGSNSNSGNSSSNNGSWERPVRTFSGGSSSTSSSAGGKSGGFGSSGSNTSSGRGGRN